MKTLNFNDRISYLRWKIQWIDAYAALSNDIRRQKNEFKAAQRKLTFGIVNEGKPWQYIAPYFDGKLLGYQKGYYEPLGDWQRSRQAARDMLELLGKAKEKCRAQWAAQHLQTA